MVRDDVDDMRLRLEAAEARLEELSRAGGGGGRRRWRPSTKGLLIGAGLALVAAPFGVAASGEALREGIRNGTTRAETEIIGDFNASTGPKGGYVTRQSNVQTGPRAGGAAIYGCRGAAGGTASDSAPCLRASNLANGFAFEFQSKSGPVGRLDVGSSAEPPFLTNARGLVTNLNADKVDGLDAEQLRGQTGPPGRDAIPGVGLSQLADPDVSSSLTYETIAPLTQTVAVPQGETRRFVATFTAESACYGDVGWCSVRILVDGNEMSPANAEDFAFDSTDNNTETDQSWESHSVQRYSGNLGPGNHTVTVERRVVGSDAVELRLDNGTLVVMPVAGT